MDFKQLPMNLYKTIDAFPRSTDHQIAGSNPTFGTLVLLLLYVCDILLEITATTA